MKKSNYQIAATFLVGLLCFGIKFITECFDATKSIITKDGMLVEPYFFLIPLGWLMIACGVVLVILKIVGGMARQKK
jgi:hypothetical protein